MKVFNTKFLMIAAAALLLAGCDDSESYSDLLHDEEQAVNWYLSGQRVCVDLPADGVFVEGADAPFYKMDDEGTLYMQVVSSQPRENNSPETGDKVYFRYMRRNIKNLYEGISAPWSGNGDNLDAGIGSTSFIYGNFSLTSSAQHGTGVQVPMQYLGYGSEVNLVVKASAGFTSEQSQCLPFLMNVRYFKAEY